MSKLDDLELLGRVRWALESDPRVPSANQVQIIVENGLVRLWGEVSSAAERAAAEEIVRSQPDMKDLDNSLTVVVSAPALDERKELAAAVQSALENAPGVDLRAVGVASISSGTVRLVGRVFSLSEENAAIAAVATVPGVRQVISEINVGQIKQRGAPLAILDDTAIKSLVDRAIAGRGVTIYDEQTAVGGGIVYLRGGIADPKDGELAERAAAAVAGVKDVVNELRVEHSLASREPDEALSARVTQALQRDGRVSPAQVHVQCVGSDAYLYGFVDSIDQQNAAAEVARRVRGVRHVFNDTVITDRTSMGGGKERERGAER